jgi:hypothetical protein
MGRHMHTILSHYGVSRARTILSHSLDETLLASMSVVVNVRAHSYWDMLLHKSHGAACACCKQARIPLTSPSENGPHSMTTFEPV